MSRALLPRTECTPQSELAEFSGVDVGLLMCACPSCACVKAAGWARVTVVALLPEDTLPPQPQCSEKQRWTLQTQLNTSQGLGASVKQATLGQTLRFKRTGCGSSSHLLPAASGLVVPTPTLTVRSTQVPQVDSWPAGPCRRVALPEVPAAHVCAAWSQASTSRICHHTALYLQVPAEDSRAKRHPSALTDLTPGTSAGLLQVPSAHRAGRAHQAQPPGVPCLLPHRQPLPVHPQAAA